MVESDGKPLRAGAYLCGNCSKEILLEDVWALIGDEQSIMMDFAHECLPEGQMMRGMWHRNEVGLIEMFGSKEDIQVPYYAPANPLAETLEGGDQGFLTDFGYEPPDEQPRPPPKPIDDPRALKVWAWEISQLHTADELLLMTGGRLSPAKDEQLVAEFWETLKDDTIDFIADRNPPDE